ncbi:hypothetical protein HPP92_020709 [Vanilla planifolia]|uniref:TTI1 N-terminal TPR domain-containing protein n=1 Tax=Vanilla planifolia TaxID=51239 RepID=A0A835UI40_VANPL|nr:hypothetical protein HPP92_020709 [Vanilla planifolia]
MEKSQMEDDDDLVKDTSKLVWDSMKTYQGFTRARKQLCQAFHLQFETLLLIQELEERKIDDVLYKEIVGSFVYLSATKLDIIHMIVVLKKLTSGALLSPSEASEEFREGIIRCLKAMLLRLKPCSVGSCSCKEIAFFSMTFNNLEGLLPTPACYEEPEECLLAFLQSKDASAAIGHWLSLLLQAAEMEAARGHRGSATLRKEAFHTLRLLVSKVGTADQLAFFLPGTVSRFTKALLSSKNVLSSAAGNAGSIEHAVRGLTEFLIIVLRDEENVSELQMSTDGISSVDSNKSRSVQTVLDALRHLPANTHTSVEHSICQSAQLSPLKDESKDINQLSYAGTKSLHVQRTKEWLDQTSAHVDKLLSATFPQLCVHHAENVRKALVDGTIGLLSHCNYTLQKSKLMLIECLCILVCDDADVVSIAAQKSLNFVFAAGKKILRESDTSELFARFLERLPKEVLGNGELVAGSHARRLLALMYYAGPELVVEHIFSTPMKGARFLDYLMLSLGHNAQFTGSINQLILSKTLSVGYLLSIANLKACSLSSDANRAIGVDALPLVTESRSSSSNMHNDYEFPRMPPWFINIGSQKLYLSLARLLRLAALSIMTGNRSDISLMAFIDNLLDHIRKVISELRVQAFNKEDWQSWYSQGNSGQLLRKASAAVYVSLHVLSTSTGHSSVGHLVVANADYIIDSLCRQLRHLDVNPHVPDVLAAMLSYIGAAREILPLLEEPMRTVSCELEIIARSQHPHLTVPFLKAVNEISKASRFESFRLPDTAKSFNEHVMLSISSSKAMGESSVTNSQDIKFQLEQLEELLLKLNEMRRYRRTVGSLATSCFKAAAPLVCSQEEAACLFALSIVEDCSKCFAKVEEAFKLEKDTKAEIERAIHMCSFNDLEDMMDAQEEEVDENRLLPAMNNIWPYLVLCLKNKVSVAVITRCASVISEAIQVAGGDFFVRRFLTDGVVIWRLLSRSPFQKTPSSKDEKKLLLPYRSTSLTSEDPMAEASRLKIHIAILNMIAGLASNKRSASALQTVFKKVSGLVVGIACSGVASLRDPSMKALLGLARMNPDPIWLLLADVYYSLKDKEVPLPPGPEFATIPQLLPPPLSSKEYLYVQYGETFNFDVDPHSVEIAFQMLNSEVFG